MRWKLRIYSNKWLLLGCMGTILGIVPFFIACNSSKNQQVVSDHPLLVQNVELHDVTFFSTALNRVMQYRVVLPTSIAPGTRLPVVYLLHGNGGEFRDWSNYSDVAQFAARGLILVMPEGGQSYYTNAAHRPQDRYEDYIVHDLISDVENRFPASRERAKRAIVGVSMGGFGAIKIVLRHPELFIFAGALSPAIDVPSRSFSWKRFRQSYAFYEIFGSAGSATRKENNPFVLVQSAVPTKVPYLFLACGDQESLLAPNRRFASLLLKHHFQYEFHIVRGDHNWAQWNNSAPECFRVLFRYIEK